jgi:hypothetical protein
MIKLILALFLCAAIPGCPVQHPACERATASSRDSVMCAFGNSDACKRLATDSQVHTDADCQPQQNP